VAEGRIENTAPFRFSLDESFDVGEDTGTPVIDEYDARMPFKFTGTLAKVQVELGADQLSPQKRGELERLKRDFAMRAQ
jgi:arylsulfatase